MVSIFEVNLFKILIDSYFWLFIIFLFSQGFYRLNWICAMSQIYRCYIDACQLEHGALKNAFKTRRILMVRLWM